MFITEQMFPDDDTGPAKGRVLDNYGKIYGVKRRRFLGIPLESDKKYRKRLARKAFGAWQ